MITDYPRQGERPMKGARRLSEHREEPPMTHEQALAIIQRQKHEDDLRGNIRRLEHAFGRADDAGCVSEAEDILNQIHEADAALAAFLAQHPATCSCIACHDAQYEAEAQADTLAQPWKRCKRCGNVLMGNEQLSETCNTCLDAGYESMTDEEYEQSQDTLAQPVQDEEQEDDDPLLDYWANYPTDDPYATEQPTGSIRSRIAALYTGIALALSILPASAHEPHWDTMPPLPTGCVATAEITEFGGAVLRCPDGTKWYWDGDGQPYENDAGYPVYPPGTWVQAKH